MVRPMPSPMPWREAFPASRWPRRVRRASHRRCLCRPVRCGRPPVPPPLPWAATGHWLLALPTDRIAGAMVVVRSKLADSALAGVGPGPFTAEAFVAAADRLPSDGPRFTSLVPTQLKRVLDSPDGADALASFDAVLVGGAALEFDPPANVVRTYGLTETAGGCVYDGVPIGDTDIQIRDDGRILIAGSSLADAYRPERPHAWVDDNGVRRLITSDLGRWDSDGRLTCAGSRRRRHHHWRLQGQPTHGRAGSPVAAVDQGMRRRGRSPRRMGRGGGGVCGARVAEPDPATQRPSPVLGAACRAPRTAQGAHRRRSTAPSGHRQGRLPGRYAPSPPTSNGTSHDHCPGLDRRRTPAHPVDLGVPCARSAPPRQPHSGHSGPFPRFLALVVGLALQIASNYANDYADGVRGTDVNRIGPSRLVASGRARPSVVKRAAYVASASARVAGVALCAVSGQWWLIVVGALAIPAAWAYTATANPYGYRGWGELVVWIFFGPVATAGHDVHSGGHHHLVGRRRERLGGSLCGGAAHGEQHQGRRGRRPRGQAHARGASGRRAARADCLPRWCWLRCWARSWSGLRLPWAMLGHLLALPSLLVAVTVWAGASGPALKPVFLGLSAMGMAYGVLLAIGIAFG